MSTGSWIVIGTVSVVFLMVIILAIFVHLVPEPPHVKEKTEQQKLIEALKSDPRLQTKAYDKLKASIDSMKLTIQKYQDSLFVEKQKNDSLKNVAAHLAQQLKKEQEKIAKLEKTKNEGKIDHSQQIEKNAKELAKTYNALSVKNLKPILDNIDNNTIINIYRYMNGRSKKNILLALPNDRAAELTKQLMQYTAN
jgi:flagellar motility protein MotE (MotC chaperone)